SYLARWSPLGYPIEPHIAQSIESSPDKRVWTITLREGMRWSDGHPFTVDDIVYWWEDEANNPATASSPPAWMVLGGKPGRVRKIDDHHVEFAFDEPYPLFLEQLAQQTSVCGSPAHYLRPFHPDPAIGDPVKVMAAMEAYKLPSPAALYGF